MFRRESTISKFIGTIIFWCSINFVICTKTCKINGGQEFHEEQPLILNEKYDIIYPSLRSPEELILKDKERVYIACPGGSLSTSSSHRDLDRLICQGEKLMDSLSNPLTFESVNCGAIPESIARSNKNTCNNGDIVEIGFPLQSNGDFVRTVEVCFNKVMATTNWAHSFMPNVISFPQKNDVSPDFKTAGFFKGLSIKNVYATKNQQIAFLRTFDNDTNVVNKYFSYPANGLYFAKGHLAANADFYYAAERASTYYYINAVPMWQRINNGNWKSIEMYIRSKIAPNTADGLDVYTGTIDILQLPDSAGKQKNIFLTRSKSNKDVIPVPKFLTKIVYDRSRHEGLVFVTVNNPHLNLGSSKSDYIICTPEQACRNHSKLKALEQSNKGYTYCCAYDDFRKKNSQFNLPTYLNSMGVMKLP